MFEANVLFGELGWRRIFLSFEGGVRVGGGFLCRKQKRETSVLRFWEVLRGRGG